MAEREPISKKLRFEIFKRDSFTCQYCGKKAPDVVLEIDHIKPVASGGDNSLLNLVTSCYDCNHGKGARELSDDSVITKQRDQLDTLQERREQIDMMIEWQQGLSDIDQYQVDQIESLIQPLLPEAERLTDHYRNIIRKLIKQYGMANVIDAFNIGKDQYLEYLPDKIDIKSVDLLLNKLPGICKGQQMFKETPELKDLFHVRNILKKKFGGYITWREMNLIKDAYACGATIDELKNHAYKVTSFYDWRNVIQEFIDQESKDVK